MKCLTPINLGSVSSPNLVPCGQCYACQTNNRNSWDLRLRIEHYESNYSSFVTLTYSDLHLPKDRFVKSEHHSEFMKNLRSLDRITKFRYYSVAEYGERTNRPHMHYLFFFDRDIDFYRLVDLSWEYGFIDVGKVTDASIHYVTKWHINPKHRPDTDSKEIHGFTRQSKGIGRLLLDNLTVDNIQPTYFFKGKRFPISRYYRKKLGFDVTDVEDIYSYIKRKYDLKTDKQITSKIAELQKIFEEKLNSPRKSIF